jgi:hypothetical protein
MYPKNKNLKMDNEHNNRQEDLLREMEDYTNNIISLMHEQTLDKLIAWLRTLDREYEQDNTKISGKQQLLWLLEEGIIKEETFLKIIYLLINPDIDYEISK